MMSHTNILALSFLTLLRIAPILADTVAFGAWPDSACQNADGVVSYTLNNDDDNNGSGCVPWDGGGPYVDGGVLNAPNAGPSYPGHLYFYVNNLCSDSSLGDQTGKINYDSGCTEVGGGISGNSIGAVCWSPTDNPHENCAGGGTARKRGLGGLTVRNATGHVRHVKPRMV